NGRLGLDCTTLSPTAQAFTPRHLAQAFESLAVSTVAVACSLRSSRVHPTLSPTSTPFPFAHRQKIRACSQGGQPQQPTSWAKTFKSPPIGHFSRFLHRAQIGSTRVECVAAQENLPACRPRRLPFSPFSIPLQLSEGELCQPPTRTLVRVRFLSPLPTTPPGCSLLLYSWLDNKNT